MAECEEPTVVDEVHVWDVRPEDWAGLVPSRSVAIESTAYGMEPEASGVRGDPVAAALARRLARG